MSKCNSVCICSFLLAFSIFSSSYAVEPSATPTPAYVALYDQGKLEEARKELDAAYGDKTDDDAYKIWKCLIDLEKAAIMKEKGDAGYDKVAFNSYLILKPLLGRNSDNPEYWLAAGKSFYLNNSRRADKSIEKALFYRKGFPDARFIQIQLDEEQDSTAAYNSFQSLAESKGTPPFVSAKAYLQLARMNYKRYERNLNANTLDSREIILEKNSKLKKDIQALLEKAIAAAPDSAYRKIAEERIRSIEAK